MIESLGVKIMHRLFSKWLSCSKLKGMVPQVWNEAGMLEATSWCKLPV